MVISFKWWYCYMGCRACITSSWAGDYDDKYIRWRPQDLPIVPTEWKLLITDSSRQQFETVKELIGKADIIVNAGDPDREGQLLVDEVLYFVGNTKPVQRILLNALDEKSVKSALGDLRDNKDFHNLYQSALARARADWLIGMNLSRPIHYLNGIRE